MRITHDCSFPGPSGLSVTNQVLKDTLLTLDVDRKSVKC